MTTPTTPTDGYYWVKPLNDSDWQIALYDNLWNLWFFCTDSNDSLPPEQIEIIGPAIPKPPELI